MTFFRTFAEFENGFGSASKEHWFGLRYQNLMTKGKSCKFMSLLDIDAKSQWNLDICGKHPADCNGQVRLNFKRIFFLRLTATVLSFTQLNNCASVRQFFVIQLYLKRTNREMQRRIN